MSKKFIFGYGSLMEKESRSRTTPNVTAIFPAKLNGFERSWSLQNVSEIGEYSTTFLGCEKKDNAEMNGILYEVSDEEFEKTKTRENGYNPTLISCHQHIHSYDEQFILNENDEVYIFTNIKSTKPNSKLPIVQSYVDICLNGCMEIEKTFPLAKQDNFTKNFFETTKLWSKHWVNDRIYPRRPWKYSPNATEIDKLIVEHLGFNLFKSIKIE